MNEEFYIVSSCLISNNRIQKNGNDIFSKLHENIHSFLVAAYQFIKVDYPKFFKMDNLCRLGFLASEILLKDEVTARDVASEKKGIVLLNNTGSIDTDVKYFETTKTIASPALFVYTLPNIVVGEICIRNNFKGENSCFIFDDFNAAFTEEYVNILFSKNILQLCICGWINVKNENYKAAFFLVTKNKAGVGLLFNKNNLLALFNAD